MGRRTRFQRLFDRWKELNSQKPTFPQERSEASPEPDAQPETAKPQPEDAKPPQVLGPPSQAMSLETGLSPSEAAKLLAAIPLPKTTQPLPASQPTQDPAAAAVTAQAPGGSRARHTPRAPATPFERREQRVAESILDNERLTADLDDSAASELLDWGLACARSIVKGTLEILDEEQADEEMYAQLRAIRRMMREVNVWVTSEQTGNAEGSEKALARIFEQTETIYGKAMSANTQERAQFAETQSKLADSAPRMIANLRHFIES